VMDTDRDRDRDTDRGVGRDRDRDTDRRLGLLRRYAALACVLAAIAAIVAVAIAAHFAFRPRLLEIDLLELCFNHENRTYLPGQNITVAAGYSVRFRGTGRVVKLETGITVRDRKGREVYRDPCIGVVFSVEYVPSAPFSVHERTGTIRSREFALHDPGKYIVTITIRGDDRYDMVKGALNVMDVSGEADYP